MVDDWKLIQRWAGVPDDGDPGAITACGIIKKAGLRHEAPVAYADITPRMVLELIEHEGIVLEAYKDSVGVWTWGLGVTNASGHQVHPRYKDKPQTLSHCLAITVWLLRTKYLPAVLAAFGSRPLAEHELAAALSFHWNTGAIGRAGWVASAIAGRRDEAKAKFMDWRKPSEIISRRKAERDLFFEGKWTSDGVVPVYSVAKPSYAPRGAKMIDISAALTEAMK